MATSVYGIDAFEYAPLGADGALPTIGWKKISPISDDAVTLTVPAVVTTDIRAADIAGVYETLPGDTDPAVIEVATLDLNGEQAAELLGGVWTLATKTYDAPAGDVINKFAVRLTTKGLNGFKTMFHIRKAAILSNIAISLQRNDLVRVGFTCRSMTPVNGSGVAQSPWGFQTVAVA